MRVAPFDWKTPTVHLLRTLGTQNGKVSESQSEMVFILLILTPNSWSPYLLNTCTKFMGVGREVLDVRIGFMFIVTLFAKSMWCEDHPFLLPAFPYGHAYIPATSLL